MLLYKGGNFMQALEGPEEDVDRLQRRIEADPRHTGIITLLKSPLEQRRFTGWSMGFRNVDTLDDADLDAFSPFLREPFTTQAFGGEPDKALKLLLSSRRACGKRVRRNSSSCTRAALPASFRHGPAASPIRLLPPACLRLGQPAAPGSH